MFFQKVTQKGFANNKVFWNIIKPFLTNKKFLTSDSNSLTNKNEMITDKKTITHSFNTHYLNIVKKASGKALEIEGNPNNKTFDMPTVKSIIKKYENHSSIININNKVVKSENRCSISLVTAAQINKIVKKLNPNTATGPDKLPPKIVILSANIIDSHLANIINHLDNNSFSKGAKVATVRPIYKKSSRDKIENYRPVRILNCFSKLYERFFHEEFKPFV